MKKLLLALLPALLLTGCGKKESETYTLATTLGETNYNFTYETGTNTLSTRSISVAGRIPNITHAEKVIKDKEIMNAVEDIFSRDLNETQSSIAEVMFITLTNNDLDEIAYKDGDEIYQYYVDYDINKDGNLTYKELINAYIEMIDMQDFVIEGEVVYEYETEIHDHDHDH